MSSSNAASDLAAQNSADLGGQTTTAFPVVTLKDGSQIPTGTIGALLKNVQHYDEAHNAKDEATMTELEAKMVPAISVMDKVGMFKLFSVQEWEAGSDQGKWGRAKVGKLAREAGVQS